MTDIYIRLYSPVIFGNFIDFLLPVTEDYLIPKRYLYNIRYGVSLYSQAFAEYSAVSSTGSYVINNSAWTVCEQYNPG